MERRKKMQPAYWSKVSAYARRATAICPEDGCCRLDNRQGGAPWPRRCTKVAGVLTPRRRAACIGYGLPLDQGGRDCTRPWCIKQSGVTRLVLSSSIAVLGRGSRGRTLPWLLAPTGPSLTRSIRPPRWTRQSDAAWGHNRTPTGSRLA